MALRFVISCILLRERAQSVSRDKPWKAAIVLDFALVCAFVPSAALKAGVDENRILSPVRLPVSPPGRAMKY